MRHWINRRCLQAEVLDTFVISMRSLQDVSGDCFFPSSQRLFSCVNFQLRVASRCCTTRIPTGCQRTVGDYESTCHRKKVARLLTRSYVFPAQALKEWHLINDAFCDQDPIGGMHDALKKKTKYRIFTKSTKQFVFRPTSHIPEVSCKCYSECCTFCLSAQLVDTSRSTCVQSIPFCVDDLVLLKNNVVEQPLGCLAIGERHLSQQRGYTLSKLRC